MNPDFSRSLSLLRQERGLSQRQVARELGISQALLSHYENGIREPGLNFVVKACDFYNVSGDFEAPTLEHEVVFQCNEPSEPVLIAVVLTVCLVMGLASAWLVYYKCRPNREAYESDEAVKRERELRRKRTKQRKGEYMSVRRGSDAGYTDKKNNLMMPLCE